MTEDPLPSAIHDALTVMDNQTPLGDAQLAALRARLSVAQAAADTEIHQLAVEGLIETLDDAMSQSDAANRNALLDMLQENLASYAVQLAREQRSA